MCEKNYDFNSDYDVTGSDQFARMVWRGDSKVGIGVAKKDITVDNLNLSCYFFVARYNDNPSKYFNSFKKNIRKGSFNTTLCRELDHFADDELAKRDAAETRASVEAKARSPGNIGVLSVSRHG